MEGREEMKDGEIREDGDECKAERNQEVKKKRGTRNCGTDEYDKN